MSWASTLILFAPSVWGFSYSDLHKLIVDTPVDSIEQLLPLLPADLRGSYTLIPNGQSSQKGTPSQPRVILFGKDGKLLLAFNGGGNQRGATVLEVIHYDDTRERFEFHSINFQTQGHAPKISEPNPGKCMVCHDTGHTHDPTPIWDNYKNWPGAYGSNDDTFLKRQDHSISQEMGRSASAASSVAASSVSPRSPSHLERPTSINQTVDLESGTTELDDFMSYLKTSKEHPRYKHLLKSKKNPVFPYYMGGAHRRLGNMPNSRLSSLLSWWNSRRIFRKIKESEFYENNKALIFLILSKCEARISVEAFEILLEKRHFSADSHNRADLSKALLKNVILALGVNPILESQIQFGKKKEDRYYNDVFGAQSRTGGGAVEFLLLNLLYQDLKKGDPFYNRFEGELAMPGPTVNRMVNYRPSSEEDAESHYKELDKIALQLDSSSVLAICEHLIKKATGVAKTDKGLEPRL